MSYDIPQTEQGLQDFIRFAEAEIKRSEHKIGRLQIMKSECSEKLTLIQKQKENHGQKGISSGGQESKQESSGQVQS